AALHAEMAELMGTTELTGNQMRKLTQDMAYAQRGLDSAAGAASKGGLAWTAQIAIANQFGQTLRGLGPAGAAAAGAMGIISRGASSMGKQMAATQITIQGVTTALRTLVLATPAVVVVLAAAAAGGLARFAKASVETATSLDTLRVQTGMTAESLQEYGYAAEKSGISVDRFGRLMGRLQRSMGRAADGCVREDKAIAAYVGYHRDSD